jgi:hypothetical protein
MFTTQDLKRIAGDWQWQADALRKREASGGFGASNIMFQFSGEAEALEKAAEELQSVQPSKEAVTDLQGKFRRLSEEASRESNSSETVEDEYHFNGLSRGFADCADKVEELLVSQQDENP